VITRQAEELELESYLIGYHGEMAAHGMRDRAEMERYYGQLKRIKGKNIKKGAILSGFGQGMSSFAKGSALFGNSGTGGNTTLMGNGPGVIEGLDTGKSTGLSDSALMDKVNSGAKLTEVEKKRAKAILAKQGWVSASSMY
jgi:hypothetical protein